MLLHISILLSDKLSQKGIEKSPKWADFALSNMLGLLKNTLPTRPNVQISYTQGGRQGFSLSDS